MDIMETLHPLGLNFRKLAEHPHGIQKQIVEVQRVDRLLTVDVIFVDLRLVVFPAQIAGEHIGPLRADLSGFVIGNVVQHRTEGIGLLIQTEFLVGFLQNAALIIGVHDREVAGHAHRRDILAQNPHAQRVNG